jgi:lysophospholipase L1-like esterase
MRRALFRSFFAFVATVIAANATALSAQRTEEPAWIASWAAAVSPPSPGGGPLPAAPRFEDQTLRQVVRLSAGGDQIRVRLTNEYGQTPLEIGAARIALADADGAIVPDTERVVTFSGATSAVIPPGAPLVSDAVDLAVEELGMLSVSIYFPGDTGPCTCHLFGLQAGYLSEPGDHTSGMFDPQETFQARAFLSGVEVLARHGGKTIVAFGDSITDGVGSTFNENRRWPDILAERLAARDNGAWGVANVGISDNRVLASGIGEPALARFDRDVLARPGVAYVIVFEGINDLGFGFGDLGVLRNAQAFAPPARTLSAADLIQGYEQLIARAHAHGVKIFGATIAPYEGSFYYAPAGEAVRQQVNEWIRTSGAFDAVFDFDAVLRDPAHPSRMVDGLHSGDFLHGADAGYRALAESIDLELFR